VLPFADGAVPFTGATLFRQVALGAMCWTLHGSLCAKLYLSMGCRARRRSGGVRESLNFLVGEQVYWAGFFDRLEGAC
jgi:hypothetical protein